MKKALLILAFCLLCAALCQGCGLLHHDAAKPTEAPAPLPATEAPAPEPTAIPNGAPTAEPTPEPTAPPTAAPTEPPYGLDMELSEHALRQLALAETRMDQAIRHIRLYPINIPSTEYSFVPADKRSGLTYEEAALYDDMLAAALEFKSIPLEGSDESVENALEALMFDHPEIEVYYTAVKEDGGWKTVCFVPEARYFTPTDDIETVKEQANAFKAVGAYVASRIPEDFSVIETPGHTPGSVCLWFKDYDTLFTGDTLFQGSVGRTDLPGGNYDALMKSIKEKLMVLPDNLKVFPGHQYWGTIGRENSSNPYLA